MIFLYGGYGTLSALMQMTGVDFSKASRSACGVFRPELRMKWRLDARFFFLRA